MTELTGIAEEILSYLTSRPEEEDTFEGIKDWWLRSNKGKHGIDEVKNTLNFLAESGEIEEVQDVMEISTYKIKKRIGV